MSTGWYARPSTRRETLPSDWAQRRMAVFRRDGFACQHIRYDTEKKCGKPATDCDHIGDRNDHSLGNLRALCDYHHSQRTAQQGGNAASAARRRKQPQKQKHPGII